MAIWNIFILCILILSSVAKISTTSELSDFVIVNNTEFELHGKKYYFLGTNYWYGMNLGAPKSGNYTRLTKELDDLVLIGVKNLRIMGSTQGPDNRSKRIVPSLEPEREKYNDDIWEGLDILLAEMKKRDMKAVVTLNNFWEWSGGFGQIIEWYENKWSSYPTSFYGKQNQTDHLNRFINTIIHRNNTVTHKLYRDDPTIMAWQLANEPRAGNCKPWTAWVNSTSSYIKSIDSNHLVSIGSEGTVAACTLDGNMIESIDYITLHAWPENWGWFTSTSMSVLVDGIPTTRSYISSNVNANKKIQKPIVLEEFGLSRDLVSFDPNSPTLIRDEYFRNVFKIVYDYAHDNQTMSGVNFWAYGGQGRPKNNLGEFWQAGDEFTGDPPHEKQGWNSVYDTDNSTKAIIAEYSKLFDALNV